MASWSRGVSWMFIMHSLAGLSFFKAWMGTKEEGLTVREEPMQMTRSAQ